MQKISIRECKRWSHSKVMHFLEFLTRSPRTLAKTLKLLSSCRSAITLANVIAIYAIEDHVLTTGGGANVHKNVRGVSATLNRRLLFRRGIDEPHWKFLNKSSCDPEDRGERGNKKHEVAKAININSEWLLHNRSELFPVIPPVETTSLSTDIPDARALLTLFLLYAWIPWWTTPSFVSSFT